jgi:hypothetical protein
MKIRELRKKLNDSGVGRAVNNTGLGIVVETLSGVIVRSVGALLKGKPHLIGDIFQNEALKSCLRDIPLGYRWDVVRRDAKEFGPLDYTNRIAERMNERYRGVNNMLYPAFAVSR